MTTGRAWLRRREGGLVLDGAHDEVVLLAVGLHAVVVGDGDVEDGISGLCAEVPHHGEVHLDLVGGGGVGEDDGGVGEVGLAGEGVAGVGEDLEVGEDGPVGDVLDVEVGVFEDGALEIVGGGVLAAAFLGEEKDELHHERVRERAHVGDRDGDDGFELGRGAIGVRHRRRADVGVVDVDLERALVRDRDAVVAVAHVEAEVLLGAVVEIGRKAHVGADGSSAGVLEVAGLGDVAEVRDLVGGEPAGGVVGLARSGRFEAGDAHLVALEDVALQGQGHGGGDEVVGVIAGDDEQLGVGVGGIGAHGDGGAGASADVEGGGEFGGVFADDDRVAGGDGAEGDRETDGAEVGEDAEPGGDDAGGLQGLGRGLGEEDDGDDGVEVDGGVVEGEGEELEVVLEREQRAGEFDGGVGVDVAPEGGVRRGLRTAWCSGR